MAKSEYVEWLRPFGREILRVLKPEGSFVLNIGGSSSFDSLSVRRDANQSRLPRKVVVVGAGERSVSQSAALSPAWKT